MGFFELMLWTFTGLIMGSFINVCIDRTSLSLAKKETQLKILKSCYFSTNLKNYILNNSLSIFEPVRSFCFKCGHKLMWYEIIPIISYFLCKGNCQKCKTTIGSKIIITEITHGLFYLATGYFLKGVILPLFFCIGFSLLWFLINFVICSRNLEKIIFNKVI